MINEKGYWETDSSFGHVYDNRLAMAIGEFLKKQNVKNLVDFGCGMGDYVKLFHSMGINCDAFDGNPNTEMLTNGLGKVLDFSSQFDLSKKYDCVLSLEVGEHIPKEYEKIFLDNITIHARNMIILSWAIVGQGGTGHVNCQNNEYIIEKMRERNFFYDKFTSELLRTQYSSASWFEKTIMVFCPACQKVVDDFEERCGWCLPKMKVAKSDEKQLLLFDTEANFNTNDYLTMNAHAR